jgi:cytochrome o ubiquinol oxidase subunit 2
MSAKRLAFGIRSPGLCRVVAAVPVCLLTACQQGGVLDPQGPVSVSERLILINATGIMLVIVVPVIVMTLAVAWWYRASNAGATYLPDWAYSGRIELVVWSIPAMVVILLAGVGWISTHQLDPARPLPSAVRAIRVDVVALDWKWLFIYPELRVATVNQLMIPEGTPVVFALTSATVMNAFFVPQLGTQIYAMPGMTTHLNLMADRAGAYAGIASHFSGDGFSDMHFVVHALSAGDFASWLARTREVGSALDTGGYAALARAGGAVPPASYGSVDAGLFDQIIADSAPAMASMTGQK